MPPRIPIAKKNRIICTTINRFSPRFVSLIATPYVHSCYTLLLPFYDHVLESRARKRTLATHTPSNGYGAQKGAQWLPFYEALKAMLSKLHDVKNTGLTHAKSFRIYRYTTILKVQTAGA